MRFLKNPRQIFWKFSRRLLFTGEIIVEPKISLVTQPVSIWGQSFKPCSPITLVASLELPSQKLSFQSHAHYTTSEKGCFHLRDAEALSGSYTGVDDMGLFWSMVPKSDSYSRVQTINGKECLKYNFSVFEGHVLEPDSSTLVCNANIERYFAGQNVKRHPIKHRNVRGTMFVPCDKGPFPTVITLYGGNKMRQVVEDAAAILSNYGFATLALAYFGVEGLRSSYVGDDMEIEFFENVLDFLQTHEQVKQNSIGVYGESKGGEIALAMASHLPHIKAAVSVNGCVSSIGTTTTYKDHVTKQLGFDVKRAKFLTDETVNILATLNDPLDEPESIHPIEYSSADLLMIAGSDDQNWRSVYYADIAKNRMHAAGKTNLETIQYAGLGHFIDAPFMPPCLKFTHPIVPKMLVSFGGGDKATHTRHQIEIWRKVIGFFSESLK